MHNLQKLAENCMVLKFVDNLVWNGNLNSDLSGSHAACHFEIVPLTQSGPSSFSPPLNPTGNTDTPTVFLIYMHVCI